MTPTDSRYQRLVDAIAAATTGDELELLRAAARAASARDGRLAGLEAEVDARRKLLMAGRALDAELQRGERQDADERQRQHAAMTPEISAPVDEGSSLEDVIAWITELARLHRTYHADADAVGRIHAAARDALAVFERVLAREAALRHGPVDPMGDEAPA